MKHADGPSDAWNPVAKGLYALGRRHEALDALRQSTQVRRQLFRREPPFPRARQMLGRRLGFLWQKLCEARQFR